MALIGEKVAENGCDSILWNMCLVFLGLMAVGGELEIGSVGFSVSCMFILRGSCCMLIVLTVRCLGWIRLWVCIALFENRCCGKGSHDYVA